MNVRLGVLGFVSFLFLSGCGSVTRMLAQDPMAEGIRGKAWQTPTFLELNAADPAVQASPTPRSLLAFHVAASGSTAYLTATFRDVATLKYDGYARRYEEGTGWAQPGYEFLRIVTGGTYNLGFTHVAPAPGGRWLSVFRDDLPASETIYTVLNNGTWQSPVSASAGVGGPSFATATADYGGGTPVDVAFDALGQGYIASINATVDTPVLHRWYQGTGVSSTLSGNAYAAGSPDPQVRVLYDGEKWVCLLSSGGPAASFELGSQCLDTTGSATWGSGSSDYSPLPSPAPVSSTGFSVATDGAGTLMAVWIASVGGVRHVEAVPIRDAVAGTPVTLSSAMPLGFEASKATQGTVDIAHLGDGDFIAVWVASSSTQDGIFYSIYSASKGTWSDAAVVGELTSNSGTGLYRSISVFSNAAGHAGLAAAYNAAGDGVYRFAVSRFQVVQGWLPVELVGNGCASAASWASGAARSVCTHRPQGFVLSGGDAVVVYPDVDSSGNFRLAGVEFR